MKRTRFKSGVYIISNKSNGRIYVGSAVDVKSRLYDHKNALQRGIHANPHLQRAWNKYEEKNFEFIPILWCSNKERLIHEQEMIDKYMASKQAYNIYPNAGSPLGTRHSQITKQKQSKARKEYWGSHEHLFKDKNPFYKKKHTEKVCTTIGEKNKKNLKGNQHARGNKFSHTPEEIEKMKNSWTLEMREAAAERGRNRIPWNKGISPSKETRNKISESLKCYFEIQRKPKKRI